jgi:hypothetical protein
LLLVALAGRSSRRAFPPSWPPSLALTRLSLLLPVAVVVIRLGMVVLTTSTTACPRTAICSASSSTTTFVLAVALLPKPSKTAPVTKAGVHKGPPDAEAALVVGAEHEQYSIVSGRAKSKQ